VAKSVLVGVVPLLLFLIPLTALMWMCQSIPPEKPSPRLGLKSAAMTSAAEDDFECEWDDPDEDFQNGSA